MYTDKPFKLKKGDLRPYYEAELRQADGTPVPNLATATSITFLMSHRHNEKKVSGAADLVDPDTALIRYQWNAGDTDQTGEYLVVVKVMWGTEPQSFPTDGYKSLVIEEQVGP